MLLPDLMNRLTEIFPGGSKDFCPNGLQVSGSKNISKVVFGVSASLEFLEHAESIGADAVIVHHGLFWNYQDHTITGMLADRVRSVMLANMNVIAYHAPLDHHQSIGNNIALAKHLEYEPIEFFGPDDAILMCKPSHPETLVDLSIGIQDKLDRKPVIAGDATMPVNKIAICTGAAGIYFQDAIDAGAHMFLTGEISEQHYHMAHESGVHYIAAGHHATERYGVQALMDMIKKDFKDTAFVFADLPNPI